MGLPQGVTKMARWGPFCLEVGGGFVTVPETLFFFGQNVRNKYMSQNKGRGKNVVNRVTI